MDQHGLTFLITSAGRRNYLVRWFREALLNLKVAGKVVVADSDPTIPARVEAHDFEQIVHIGHPEYPAALEEICSKHHVDLALSLNDYELSAWARIPWRESSRTILLRLEPAIQHAIEDKCALSALLNAHSLQTPATITLQGWLDKGIVNRSSLSDRFIVKNRFGSGSGGLVRLRGDEVSGYASEMQGIVQGRDGTILEGKQDVVAGTVVQPQVEGVEYGLDVVCDLNGDYVGTLARRKLAMRGGETDKAVTAPAAEWYQFGKQIASAVPHRGTMDVDVIVDTGGRSWILDINPRFGGGYPFCHVAGADIPAAYVAWLQDNREVSEYLSYSCDVAAAKCVDIVRTYPTI